MRIVTIASRLLIVCNLALAIMRGTELAAQQRHSQIVLPLDTERPYTYRYEPADRALVLEIERTSSAELEPFFHYDESVIRRVFFKELGDQAVEVRLILRDEGIKVMVHSFQEPFRLTIDLFDSDYREGLDPHTGLPLVPLVQNSSPTAGAAGPMRLQEDPAPAAQPKTGAEPSGRRRLLQPMPEAIRTGQELLVKLNDTSGGIGESWKAFPPYVYRVQTATLKTGKDYEGWLKQNAGKAMNSAEAMAQYASQLYDFGHEQRALLAYQKVLHDDPSVFDRNADHIWKLGEIHLGQGNLTLADGYYESLQSKHPDQPLAAYAALRRLDIRAIRAVREQKTDAIASLRQPLDQIQVRNDPGLKSQIALRRAYWQIDPAEIKRLLPAFDDLPTVGPNLMSRLEEARGDADSPRSAFLIDSILLKNRLLTDTWSPDLARFAGEYFDRYKGKATEPYREQLLKQSQDSVLKAVDRHLKDQNHAAVVALIESLPKSLSTLKDRESIAWATAESYRHLQQPLAALPYYATAAKIAGQKPDQFRANFWLTQSHMAAIDVETARKAGQDQIDNLQRGFRTADQKSWDTWQTLTADEKRLLYAETQEVMEQNIRSPHLMRTSPRILLEMWNAKLASDAPTPGTAVNQTQGEAQPTARMIVMFADLSKRFEQLGLDKDRQKAKLLQKRINLKGNPIDKDTLKIWTNELTQLADEYRRDNNYLEAGRIYALTGSENNQWEGRAEALYKGGLLLYRSGRREEAVAALQQAADDGNNLLYAELAKKRLEQLQP
jgi:hypothetical protein